jgi:hypothetical protein
LRVIEVIIKKDDRLEVEIDVETTSKSSMSKRYPVISIPATRGFWTFYEWMSLLDMRNFEEFSPIVPQTEKKH